jgi:hypothetical protein
MSLTELFRGTRRPCDRFPSSDTRSLADSGLVDAAAGGECGGEAGLTSNSAISCFLRRRNLRGLPTKGYRFRPRPTMADAGFRDYEREFQRLTDTIPKRLEAVTQFENDAGL